LQQQRWGDLRERNWSRVREWGPGFERRDYYRGPDWDDWRRRHYVERPRYRWDQDRYSRPWFDYGSVTYLSIYAPTYIVPYGVYDTYGTSYYGPVGCNRNVVGTVIGGVAGALIGANNGGGGATVGGAIVGAILGGALGQAIDMSDQACYGQVLEYVPNNQPVYWDDNGAQYQVTPLRTYQGSDGLYCREYQTSIYIDGYPQQAYGTACRQPDGSWQLQN
jgi:surface antigen